MDSKTRAALRAQANTLDPIFQLGKGGINDNFIDQTNTALDARELIKIKILLDTSPVSPKEAAEDLSAKTGADVIQVIGGVIVLYRYNPALHEKKKTENKKSEQHHLKKAFTYASYKRGFRNEDENRYKSTFKTAKEHKDEKKRKSAAKRKSLNGK
jgi:RNA-binding protein